MHTFDLTAVYYTAHTAPKNFTANTWSKFIEAFGSGPIVVVGINLPYEGSTRYAFTKFLLGDDEKPSHFNIYRMALQGAKEATTKYISLVEDDQLYSPEHFKYRPRKKPFAYNLGYWGIYSWQDPSIYNYKGRRNLGNLICDRVAFIDAMEERFRKYPIPDNSIKDIWGEPSKYERHLGVTPREAEDFYTNPPNIKFSHETELSFAALGTRKRAGELRAYDIPFWRKASDIIKLYKET